MLDNNVDNEFPAGSCLPRVLSLSRLIAGGGALIGVVAEFLSAAFSACGVGCCFSPPSWIDDNIAIVNYQSASVLSVCYSFGTRSID